MVEHSPKILIKEEEATTTPFSIALYSPCETGREIICGAPTTLVLKG